MPGVLYPKTVFSCVTDPESYCAVEDWRGSEQCSGFFKLIVFALLSDTPVLPTGYGIEHAQCVPPSEFSEPSFITESYQTLHPISSEELLSLKYENDYSVILRDPVQTDSLQTDYFTIKQEVVTPDNMCMGRASRGTVGHLPGLAWVLAFSTYMSLQVLPSPLQRWSLMGPKANRQPCDASSEAVSLHVSRMGLNSQIIPSGGDKVFLVSTLLPVFTSVKM